jgi:hypothetical protein
MPIKPLKICFYAFLQPDFMKRWGEQQADWQEIVRESSPRNEGQRKVRVLVKPAQSPDGSPEHRPLLE